MMVRLKRLEFVPSQFYLLFCNLYGQCRPTYRVYDMCIAKVGNCDEGGGIYRLPHIQLLLSQSLQHWILSLFL